MHITKSRLAACCRHVKSSEKNVWKTHLPAANCITVSAILHSNLLLVPFSSYEFFLWFYNKYEAACCNMFTLYKQMPRVHVKRSFKAFLQKKFGLYLKSCRAIYSLWWYLWYSSYCRRVRNYKNDHWTWHQWERLFFQRPGKLWLCELCLHHM